MYIYIYYSVPPNTRRFPQHILKYSKSELPLRTITIIILRYTRMFMKRLIDAELTVVSKRPLFAINIFVELFSPGSLSCMVAASESFGDMSVAGYISEG